MELQGRAVLVVGAGKTGVAVARFCAGRGARVTLTDSRTGAELHGARTELGDRVAWELGGHRKRSFVTADLIVLSPGVPDIEPIRAARKAKVEITGEIELASRFIAAPLVGITGTNGKSTVTALCGEMARQTGRPTFVGGNLGTPLISCIDTPAAAMGIVVVELSSFQLETCETLRPRAATILNITPDHLDRYPSFDAYAAAKLRLVQRMTVDDVVVVASDEAERAVRGARPELRLVRVDPSRDVDGGDLVRAGERYPAGEMQLVGRHNQSNALAALALMRGAGLCTVDEGRAALRSFAPLPHRMQLVGERGGVRFYDDSKATNVDSVVAGVDGFPRSFVLIAGGRDKGGSYAPLARALEKNKCRAVILIGEAAQKIADAMPKTLRVAAAVTLPDAVAMASALCTSGDAVVLSPACSSYDMFDNYEHRGRVFAAAVEAMPA